MEAKIEEIEGRRIEKSRCTSRKARFSRLFVDGEKHHDIESESSEVAKAGNGVRYEIFKVSLLLYWGWKDIMFPYVRVGGVLL